MRCKTLAAAALAALCASGEQAKLFIFTYIETSSTPTIFTSELKLVTTDVLTDGHYTITGVSGWFSGPSLDASDQVVTGLGGYASPDNFLYPAGPFLDAAGFSVDTATPNLFNFYMRR